MKTKITAVLAALLLLVAPMHVSAKSYVALTAAQTGLNGSALSTTPVSSAIDMQNVQWTNQLTLVIVLTPGTTTNMTAKCQESADNSSYGWIQRCTDATPSVCTPREWSFDTTSETLFTMHVPVNAHYVKCQFDDAADGTGTIVVTGVRGEQ